MNILSIFLTVILQVTIPGEQQAFLNWSRTVGGRTTDKTKVVVDYREPGDRDCDIWNNALIALAGKFGATVEVSQVTNSRYVNGKKSFTQKTASTLRVTSPKFLIEGEDYTVKKGLYTTYKFSLTPEKYFQNINNAFIQKAGAIVEDGHLIQRVVGLYAWLYNTILSDGFLMEVFPREAEAYLHYAENRYEELRARYNVENAFDPGACYPITTLSYISINHSDRVSHR